MHPQRRQLSVWIDLLEDRLVANADSLVSYTDWKNLTVSIADGYDTVARINDYESGKLIGLDQVRATTNYTGKGYSVAVIDTGVDYNHSSLGGGWGKRVIGGYDFVDNDVDPMDTNGHGTHVAGIIASSDVNYQGIAPEANIIALRVLGTDGSGSFDDVEAALRWVINNQATYNIVSINMSLGSGNYLTNPFSFLEDEFSSLISQGVFTAVSAGNDFGEYQSAQGLAYAAVSNQVIAVGAVYDNDQGQLTWGSGITDYTTAPDRIVGFSQRSSGLDILAPGVNVRASKLGGGSTNKSGTSMASPMIAGAAAILHQVFDAQGLGSRANQATIYDVMQRTGKVVVDGDDENDSVVNTGLSFKRLQLKSAIDYLTPSTPTPTPTPTPSTGISVPISLGQSSGTAFTLTNSWSASSQAWYSPVTGDFNGDGRTDVAVWNVQNNQLAVGLSTGTALNFTYWGPWSSTGAKLDIVSGDFNGDGKSDLAGRNPTNGNWEVLTSNGSSFTSKVWTSWSTAGAWVDLQVGDVNGDGKSDLLARHAPSGQWWLARSTGSGFTNQLWQTWSTQVTWVDVKCGDFNKDGMMDVAGRVKDSGAWWVGYSNGATGYSRSVTGWASSVNWSNVVIGDFNGDGRDDLAGQAAGEWWTSFGSSSQFVTQRTGGWSPGVTWNDVKVGDFNGDGRDDIVGHAAKFGELWIAKSAGGTMINERWGSLNAGVDFRNLLVSDLNKDGKQDLVGFGPQSISANYADVVVKSTSASNAPQTNAIILPIDRPTNLASLRSLTASSATLAQQQIQWPAVEQAERSNGNSTTGNASDGERDFASERNNPMSGHPIDQLLSDFVG